MLKSVILIFTTIFFISNSFAKRPIGNNFIETPIILSTPTGFISGTLTMPMLHTKVPLAILVAGAGQVDRNGNLPNLKNESLSLLAYGLAHQNIASIRYDKRGVGESKSSLSKEEELSMEIYIDDVSGWISMFRADHRFSKIIVIGHSFGSMIGMAAAKSANAFVSIAATGKAPDKLMKEEIYKQPKEIQDIFLPIIDSLIKGKTVKNLDPMAESLFRPSIQPFLISCYHYDPVIEIRKLNKLPILIIQGTNDLQIPIKDSKLLAGANQNAQFVLVERMNHVFKIVKADNSDNYESYNIPEMPISEEMVNKISFFIRSIK